MKKLRVKEFVVYRLNTNSLHIVDMPIMRRKEKPLIRLRRILRGGNHLVIGEL